MAEFLYQGLVDWFQDQVEKGHLSAGDKMPSLRKLSKEQGLSLNTIIHGYELLAKEGWIEARTKSGYYVCHRSHLRSAVMAATEKGKSLEKGNRLSLDKQHRFTKALHCNAFNLVGNELFSVQLNNMKASHPQGEPAVRGAIASYLDSLSIKTRTDQIWLANRATSLLAQTIQSLTNTGAKVLLITPCDFRLTQLILDLDRVPVTLSVGDHGADLDAVEKLLSEQEVQLLVLPSQFAFPIGQELSNMALRRWYALIESQKLPTIEWDMSSQLPNRPHNIMTLKSLDKEGYVLYLGGFEGLHDAVHLAWLIMTGRYETQLAGSLKALDLSPGIDQQLALLPLLTDSKKRTFSLLARALWTNAEKVKYRLEQISGGRLTAAISKGGYSLWVYCEKAISSEMWEEYEATHLSTLIPGELLSQDADASHWLAFNLSITDQFEETFNWLKQAWQEESIPSNKSDGTTSEESEATEGDKQTSNEPVYNPMLDLINHDFG